MIPPHRLKNAFPNFIPSPHQAAIDAFVLAADKGGPDEEIDAFLQKHPDLIDKQDSTGMPAMIAAAQDGKRDVIKKLLACGANVDVRDRWNWTPLVAAAHGGYADIVQDLIDAGAAIDAVAQEGWTALMWACRMGREDVVVKLINAGADVERLNEKGKSAPELACAYPEIIDLVERWIDSGKAKNMRTAVDLRESERRAVENDRRRLQALRGKKTHKNPFAPKEGKRK